MIWNEKITTKDLEFIGRINSSGKKPKHIAIIMDGNGRWAENKNLQRVNGHRQGIETVREVVKTCSTCGIEFLTLYAFSIENWKRPANEVDALMKLLERFLKKEVDELHSNRVRIKTIGKTNSLPKSIQNLLHNAIDKTKENDGLTLILALSYGSRWDIVRAVQMISLDSRRGRISPEDITEEFFASKLQTSDFPNPDLLIRTSGELRISNFLLWELAYSEIYVTETLWPDFKKEDLHEAIESYTYRERRFGKTSSQISEESNNQKPSYLQKVVNVFKK